MGLGGDEAPGDEHPVDGRDRGHLASRGRHVEVDRLGPGVEAGVGQLLSDAHDLVLVEVGDPRRTRSWAAATGLEPGLTLEAVAAQQLVEPALGSRRGRPPARRSERPVRRCVSIRNRPLSIGDPFHFGVSYVLTHPGLGMSPMS